MKSLGLSPLLARIALIIGNTNPTIQAKIKVRIPSPKKKISGMLIKI